MGFSSHTESRLWLVAGLLLPIWNRLPGENMRVRRLATDAGVSLLGRVLTPEQAHVATRSPMSWAHINMLGEYDFSEEKLRDALGILPLKSVA